MKKTLIVVLSAMFLSGLFLGCGGGNDPAPAATQAPPQTQEPIKSPEYLTSVTSVMSKAISASQGGMVEVTDANSLINGIKLIIPAGALGINTTISVGQVNNPPLLPIGLNFVGVPIDFGPDGTTFSKPATIEIPFTQADLDQAGVSSKTALKLFNFDNAKNDWSEAKVISIDTVKNVIIGQVEHFSSYALVGLSGGLPDDLGRPQPGDVLYKLSRVGALSAWVPGHEGIFTGEKIWNKEGLASDDVKRCGKYNAVEALIGGVQYSYYKIPNTEQSCKTETLFSGDSIYMGARESKDFTLTFEQRMKVVEFVEQQVGKPYVIAKTFGVSMGLLASPYVKGPDKFNCVGLVEKAYEIAGANDGEGILKYDDIYTALVPLQQYLKTKPAGGAEDLPVIIWASLSPNSGTASTQVLAQIAVSHPRGLDYIDSVRYVADSGYINPSISINDAGTGGDLKAGDGIYSAKSAAGQDASLATSMGLTFTVTDKDGKSASVRLIYTYNGGTPTYGEVAPKMVSERLLYGSGSWAR